MTVGRNISEYSGHNIISVLPLGGGQAQGLPDWVGLAEVFLGSRLRNGYRSRILQYGSGVALDQRKRENTEERSIGVVGLVLKEAFVPARVVVVGNHAIGRMHPGVIYHLGKIGECFGTQGVECLGTGFGLVAVFVPTHPVDVLTVLVKTIIAHLEGSVADNEYERHDS